MSPLHPAADARHAVSASPAANGAASPIESLVGRRPAACKVAVAFAWVVAIAATPGRAVWAFAIHAVLVLAVVRLARIAPRVLLRRLVLDVPFVAFAVALAFVGTGERTDVLGVPLRNAGLWAMWTVLAKATLGLVVAVVLGATTPPASLLRGLEQLRVPRLLISVAGLMVRYLHVIAGDVARMRVARTARGADPRWLWQSRAIAAGAGTVFVRSYERGERVHLAMAARGFTGAMPRLVDGAPPLREWAATSVPALVASVVATVALLTT